MINLRKKERGGQRLPTDPDTLRAGVSVGNAAQSWRARQSCRFAASTASARGEDSRRKDPARGSGGGDLQQGRFRVRTTITGAISGARIAGEQGVHGVLVGREDRRVHESDAELFLAGSTPPPRVPHAVLPRPRYDGDDIPWVKSALGVKARGGGGREPV